MASSDGNDGGLTPTDIVLVYVCPALGMVVANFMFLAPLKDLQAAVTIGLGLGDLNPTPWAFMLGNCLGWSAYGVLKNNWFIFWANYPGFLIACWLNLGAVKLLYSSHHREETRRSLVNFLSSHQDDDLQRRSFFRNEGTQADQDNAENGGGDGGTNERGNGESVACGYGDDDRAGNAVCRNGDANNATPSQVQDWAKIVWEVTSQTTPARTPHERLVLGMILLWTLVLSGIGFANHYLNGSELGGGSDDSQNIGQTVVGYVVNFNLVFFYGAPLSAIGRVLKTKRSDMLHAPTMAMNTTNSIFWTAYAIAPQIRDPFVYVPNGLGVVLGAIQFALWIVFPRNTKQRRQSDCENETSGEIDDVANGETGSTTATVNNSKNA